MSKKLVLTLSLVILLFSLLPAIFKPVEVKATDGERVHNLNTGFNYTTIQAAIDDSGTMDGHTIFVEAGTYYEHVVVTKSLLLIGEDQSNTIVNGSALGTVIHIIADSVTVKGFTITNGNVGIHVDHSSNSIITENNASNNLNIDKDYAAGILVSYSSNTNVSDNIVGSNDGRGILVTNSADFTVTNNFVYGSGMYGLNSNSSINGRIAQNDAYGNDFDGIGLLSSNSCLVVANNVSNNPICGIYIESDPIEASYNNLIYHNNIINNGAQAVIGNPTNRWDDGAEGNYWSDYTGVDLFSGPYQNETGNDGIGDSPYNTDNFPLVGRFNSFETPYNRQVNIISNSSISNFNLGLLNSSHAFLSFNVEGQNETGGFCRIRIPKFLINGSYVATFDGTIVTEPQFRELIPPSNETFEYLYINYTHSNHSIEITGTTMIPEFPYLIVLSLFAIATVLTVMLHRRKALSK